jgi:hypothetical protein
VLPVSFGTCALCGLIWVFIVGPIAKTKIEARVAEKQPVHGVYEQSFKEPGYEVEEGGDVIEGAKKYEFNDETSEEEGKAKNDNKNNNNVQR